MHADRIDILHVANDDAVVRLVAEDFVLDLFPAEQRRFHERLMDDTGVETARQRRAQLRFVLDHAAAGTAEGECGTHDERIAVFGRKDERCFNVGDDHAQRHGLADFDHLVLEALAIFGELNRLERRAQQLDIVAFEHAGFG